MARPKKGQSPWVTTPEILAQLQISRWHLYNLKDDLFRSGYHYRDIRANNSTKACYRWHSKRIEKLLDQTPERR